MVVEVLVQLPVLVGASKSCIDKGHDHWLWYNKGDTDYQVLVLYCTMVCTTYPFPTSMVTSYKS